MSVQIEMTGNLNQVGQDRLGEALKSVISPSESTSTLNKNAGQVLEIAKAVEKEFKASHPYFKEIFYAAVQAAFGPLNVT